MATPHADLKKVKKVLKYRQKKDGENAPMSFRNIANKMGHDVKTIYRWYRKGLKILN